jgi:hypothetical protein
MKTLFISMLKGAIIGVIGAFLIVQLFGLILPEIKKPPPDPEKKSQLSDEILSYILDLRIENAYIVYAQARLESGNFTSDIFMENNNLFGMKVAERRPTTAIGVNRGHAVYKSWRESVIDYALMQAAYYRGLDEKTYLDKICSVYATDTTYRKRLEAMKND